MTAGPSAPELRGLSSDEVIRSREQHGSNLLTPPERDPWWKLFLEKFDDPIIRILLIAAVVAIGVGAMHGEYLEGLGILAAVFLATILAFVNEHRANKEFDILNAVNDEVPLRVLRDGEFKTVPKHEIVVGDLVLIEAGEEVPADGRLVEAVSLSVNESGLTGESEPVQKLTADSPNFAALSARTYGNDMVLRGCMVLDGHGMFEVSKVGDSTEIGQTVRAAAEETGDETPLNIQLERLSKVIGVVGLVVAVTLFAALVVRGLVSKELVLTTPQAILLGLIGIGGAVASLRIWLPMVYDGLEMVLGIQAPEWLEAELSSSEAMWQRAKLIGSGILIVVVGVLALRLTGSVSNDFGKWLPADVVEQFIGFFMVAVTIIVVAVPEGLAMSVTLSLAYSMRRMTAANTLVRKMHACETIGAATVICSDKTGTLTMNEMRVFEAVYPSLKGSLNPADPNHQLIIENIATNTTAHLSREEGSIKGLGNPTESALLLWLNAQQVDYVIARDSFHLIGQLTFSTERKWMGTFGRSSSNGHLRLHTKGAPEIILARCETVLREEGEKSLSDSDREGILAELRSFQSRGMRTLGMAYRIIEQEAESLDVEASGHRLVWLGFLAIADPIRSDVPQAVQACKRAGIKIKMVTGDSQPTAQEIARQIGLWDPSMPPDSHVGGPQFLALDDAAAEQAADALKVMSRAKPLDKVRLVRSLQAQGEVVAVTGDGVNDCGALNYANVGLAMGKTGTAAAKEASDIILLDDSFATIVNAVMWGRSLYANIQRFITFQLTINVAALAIALLGPFIGVQLPLTVIQMLWVNLIMDTFAALALATEPPQKDVMNRPPRHPEDFIINRGMAQGIFGLGIVFVVLQVALLFYLNRDGEVTNHETSIFFTSFVLLQFWNLFNARCLGQSRSAFAGLSENKSFLGIALAIFVGQVLIVTFGGELFRTSPLSVMEWVVITAATSVVLWCGELYRMVKRLSGSAESGAK